MFTLLNGTYQPDTVTSHSHTQTTFLDRICFLLTVSFKWISSNNGTHWAFGNASLVTNFGGTRNQIGLLQNQFGTTVLLKCTRILDNEDAIFKECLSSLLQTSIHLKWEMD